MTADYDRARLASKTMFGNDALHLEQGLIMAGFSPVSLSGFKSDSMLGPYAIFAEVAACKSMSEAAWHLDLDVSVVSRHIVNLERTLDCILFERHRRGVRLSSAGQVLAAHVTEVLRAEEKVRQEIADLRGLRKGTLRIVGTDGAIVTPLADLISHFLSCHPGIQIELFRGPSEQIVASLHAGHAELGAGLNLGQEAGIEIVATYSDRLCAIMSPSHPLARTKSLTLSEIQQYPVGTFERNSGIGRLLQKLGARGAPPLQVALVTNSLEALRRYCANNMGISLLAAHSINDAVALRQLVAIPLDFKGPIAVNLDICLAANAVRTFALSAFLEQIRKKSGFSAPSQRSRTEKRLAK